jgi:hypothetical protein
MSQPKIVLSKEFSSECKVELVELAAKPQFSLSLKRDYYSTITIQDVSMAQAKRYTAKILILYSNDDIIRLGIYQATQNLKAVVEHHSDRSAMKWANQKPHVITLFVYQDLDDWAQNNWIARSIWRDPNNSAARLVPVGTTNDFTADVQIQFADYQKHQAWRQFALRQVTSKYEFIKKVERWYPLANDIVKQALHLTQQKNQNLLLEPNYVQKMHQLATSYVEQVQHKFDEGTTGPSEVRDAEMKYVQTILNGGNIFLLFSNRGQEIWTDGKQRDYLLNKYIRQYFEDAEMLEFELKKLR